MQNAAARIISGARKYTHISRVLIQLHWIPVATCMEFKVLLLAYKYVDGLAPSYIVELLQQQMQEWDFDFKIRLSLECQTLAK